MAGLFIELGPDDERSLTFRARSAERRKDDPSIYGGNAQPCGAHRTEARFDLARPLAGTSRCGADSALVVFDSKHILRPPSADTRCAILSWSTQSTPWAAAPPCTAQISSGVVACRERRFVRKAIGVSPRSSDRAKALQDHRPVWRGPSPPTADGSSPSHREP